MVEAICFQNEHQFIPSAQNDGTEVCRFCGMTRKAPKPYPRPDLSEEEKRTLALAAHQINQLHDTHRRLLYIGALVAENARLTAECNQLRSEQGYEPLPSYDPRKADI